jgi:pimeloyl-ACP methyl ester carboxylesterase
MQAYPASLQAVILDSPVPPHFQSDLTTGLAINELIESCLSTPECADAYPELAIELRLVISRLNQHPVEIRSDRPGTEEGTTWLVDGDYYSDLLANTLRDSSVLSLIPMVIHETASGRHAFIELPMQMAIEMIDSASLGTNYSIQCFSAARNFTASYAGPETGGMDSATVATETRADLDDCTEWRGETPLASSDLELDITGIPAEIPTLVLSGRFDPLTRPGYGQWITQHLGIAQAMTFGNAGHGVIGSSDCADALMAEFLEGPSEKLDLSCVRDVSEIDFVTEADIIRLPLVEFGLGIRRRSPLVLGMLGALALAWAVLTIGSFITAVLLFTKWIMRRLAGDRSANRPDVPNGHSTPQMVRSVPSANLAAGLLLNLALLFAISVELAEGYEGNLSVVFGLPRYALEIPVMLWVATFCSLLGSVGTVLGLFRADWSVLRKAAQGIISVSMMVLLSAMAMLVGWGLL